MPYLFEGSDSVERWSQEIKSWHESPGKLVLKHKFGPLQDLKIHDDTAFLPLSTHPTITTNGNTHKDDGGKAFLLVKENIELRVSGYGSAVTQEED